MIDCVSPQRNCIARPQKPPPMQVLYLTLKTLFSGRIKYITWVAICAFLLAGVSGLWPVQSQQEWVRNAFQIISNLLLGIGTSTLAAALISTFDLINVTKVGNLIKLFSIDTTKKTAIVIPRFDKKYFDEKEEGNYDAADKTPNEVSFLSFADFSTAKFLVALLQEHHLGVPDIITDSEAMDILSNKEKIKRYKSLICVGLYSNQLSNHINSLKLPNRYFEFSGRSIIHPGPGERQLKILQPVKSNEEKWYTHTPNSRNCCDLAMISKIHYKLEGEQSLSISIVGGLNATGTILLGNLFTGIGIRCSVTPWQETAPMNSGNCIPNPTAVWFLKPAES